jgi:hypothetical protein
VDKAQPNGGTSTDASSSTAGTPGALRSIFLCVLAISLLGYGLVQAGLVPLVIVESLSEGVLLVLAYATVILGVWIATGVLAPIRSVIAASVGLTFGLLVNSASSAYYGTSGPLSAVYAGVGVIGISTAICSWTVLSLARPRHEPKRSARRLLCGALGLASACTLIGMAVWALKASPAEYTSDYIGTLVLPGYDLSACALAIACAFALTSRTFVHARAT